jgi:hypothetical protein
VKDWSHGDLLKPCEGGDLAFLEKGEESPIDLPKGVEGAIPKGTPLGDMPMPNPPNKPTRVLCSNPSFGDVGCP